MKPKTDTIQLSLDGFFRISKKIAQMKYRKTIARLAILVILIMVYIAWLFVIAPDELHSASYNGDINKMRRLLWFGAPVDVRDSVGETPLHEAAEMGCISAIKLLLSRGANIEARDDFGRTPLHMAAGNVRLDSKFSDFMFLISKKNNLGTATPNIESQALRNMIDRSSVCTLQLLVEHGAIVDAKDDSMQTPLHCAAYTNRQLSCEYLISKGIPIDEPDRLGNTALHVAAHENALESAKVLLAHGANVDIKNDEGINPLSIAKKMGYINLAKCLRKSERN